MIDRVPTSWAYEYRISSVFGIGKDEENAVRGGFGTGPAFGGWPKPNVTGLCPGRRCGGLGGYECEASFPLVIRVVACVFVE